MKKASDLDELIKGDESTIKGKKKHKSVDDDLMEEENKDKDLGINDERSIAADSLKELNKLSNHSQQNPIKEDPKKSNSFISMKQKDSKGTASKDDAPKD